MILRWKTAIHRKLAKQRKVTKMFAWGVSPTEGIIIVGIIVVLFGAKKLPELGRSLGQGIKEFKKSSKGLFEDEKEDNSEEQAANQDV